jgi:hypothetical protein
MNQQQNLKNIFYLDLVTAQKKVYINLYNDRVRIKLLELTRQNLSKVKDYQKIAKKHKSLFFEDKLPANAIIISKDEAKEYYTEVDNQILIKL